MPHTATETLKNSTYQFWLCQDSNPWPQDCETKALPLSYLSFDRNFDFWYWGHMASLTVLDFRFCHIFVNFCHQKRALDSDSVHPGPSHLYLSKISTICDQFIMVPAANRCKWLKNDFSKFLSTIEKLLDLWYLPWSCKSSQLWITLWPLNWNNILMGMLLYSFPIHTYSYFVRKIQKKDLLFS